MNDIKALLAYVRRDQDITWNSDITDSKLTDIIEEAIPELTHILGAKEIDFLAPGAPRRLLKAYCLYAMNKCLNEFQEAYSKDIIQIRNKYLVQRVREELRHGSE